VTDINYDYTQIALRFIPHQQLPAQQSYPNSYAEPSQTMYTSSASQAYDEAANCHGFFSGADSRCKTAYQQPMLVPTEENQPPPFLEDRNEVLYMQVFVEEVGLWMDSMDADKHFSRLIPFQALREPMLKYALLACGVRHLTLVNSVVYPEEHALNYYNSATQLLLKSLQNPDRDSVLCATAATILNVYEVMSEKALQRMNHIAGARALIKECRWNATATGIGSCLFLVECRTGVVQLHAFQLGASPGILIPGHWT